MITIKNIKIGNGNPIVLIAGPCVVENETITMNTANEIKKITSELKIPFIFKSSYKKANRTSINSFTGLEYSEAVRILKKVKNEFDLPLLTDVHTEKEAELAAEFADVIQIPAFLSRQTDLLIAAGKTGKVINVKKGQFLAPDDMIHVITKIESTGNKNILLTERGTTFGYHDLVVDMRSLEIMKSFGFPVIMDATHSVQMPSKGEKTGGQPEFIPVLARAATAVGIDGLFLEVHPNPSNALSDAASQLPLNKLFDLLVVIINIDKLIKNAK
ncbi:3-deoxy-8-phosphooctulonate synthase [Melioribacteraceae bacterium 4301-Me]|uniref:3-deoxy-8-phosphooctulonate synthase n=1 Tax=Pyranulibacter aquaticus TaxID=3163344 RepID=UPI003594FAF8